MNLWRRFMNWIHGYGLPLEVEVAALRCRVDALEKSLKELKLRERATYYIPLTNQWHAPAQKFDPNE